jgi:hypothetical protein
MDGAVPPIPVTLSLSSVVLPYPAGAETRVSLLSSPSINRSISLGRTTSPDRLDGICSFVFKSESCGMNVLHVVRRRLDGRSISRRRRTDKEDPSSRGVSCVPGDRRVGPVEMRAEAAVLSSSVLLAPQEDWSAERCARPSFPFLAPAALDDVHAPKGVRTPVAEFKLRAPAPARVQTPASLFAAKREI